MDNKATSNGILKFQALWKGHHVRQKLLLARKEFSAIYSEIEGRVLDECVCATNEWLVNSPLMSKSSERNDAFPEKQDVVVHGLQNSAQKITTREISCQVEHGNGSQQLCDCNTIEQNPSSLSSAPTLVFSERPEVHLSHECIVSPGLSNRQSSSPITASMQVPDTGNLNDKMLLASSSTPSRSHGLDVLHPSGNFTLGSNFDAPLKDILSNSWLSGKSFFKEDDDAEFQAQGSVDSLRKMYHDLSLELLWIRQAIRSRKEYLKLKKHV